MGKTLYLECYSGISGDMTVAALLDLGADRGVLDKALYSLPVSGFRTKISRVKKSGLDACDFNVILEHDNHDHDMEELATRGKSKAGNNIRIYISNINFEATYSYLDTNTIQLSMIRIYSINSITTQDSEMFRGLKEWIQSLKKFSTLISESGEMQRIQFFKQQREIIGTL